MADNRLTLPSGSGGITRYMDEQTSKIEIKPQLAIAFVVAMTILIIVIHILVRGLF